MLDLRGNIQYFKDDDFLRPLKLEESLFQFLYLQVVTNTEVLVKVVIDDALQNPLIALQNNVLQKVMAVVSDGCPANLVAKSFDESHQVLQ